jgi:hypothetical protein
VGADYTYVVGKSMSSKHRNFCAATATVARCMVSDRLAPSFVQASMSLLLLRHDLYSCTNIQHVSSTAVCQEHNQKGVRAQLKRGPCRTCQKCSCWHSSRSLLLIRVCTSCCLSGSVQRRPLRLLPASQPHQRICPLALQICIYVHNNSRSLASSKASSLAGRPQ